MWGTPGCISGTMDHVLVLIFLWVDTICGRVEWRAAASRMGPYVWPNTFWGGSDAGENAESRRTLIRTRN